MVLPRQGFVHLLRLGNGRYYLWHSITEELKILPADGDYEIDFNDVGSGFVESGSGISSWVRQHLTQREAGLAQHAGEERIFVQQDGQQQWHMTLQDIFSTSSLTCKVASAPWPVTEIKMVLNTFQLHRDGAHVCVALKASQDSW